LKGGKKSLEKKVHPGIVEREGEESRFLGAYASSRKTRWRAESEGSIKRGKRNTGSKKG